MGVAEPTDPSLPSLSSVKNFFAFLLRLLL
jgi:hypothetical protein